MVTFPDKKIYLYSRETDFRKGILSLTSLICNAFPGIDQQNSLFLFFSKNGRQVRIVEFEKDGIWMHQKKLLHHRFLLPKAEKEDLCISASELTLILKTIQPLKLRK